jgi:hypothetical protein
LIASFEVSYAGSWSVISAQPALRVGLKFRSSPSDTCSRNDLASVFRLVQKAPPAEAAGLKAKDKHEGSA